MKIALVTPSYPPYRGGMGNAAYHFASGLKNLNHQVDVFTPLYHGISSDILKDSSVHYMQPVVSYGNAAWVPQLIWLLRGYNIVYAHTPFIGAAGALLITKLVNPRSRLIVHYQMDLEGNGGILKWLFWLYTHIVVRLLLHAADTIIVSTEEYAWHSLLSGVFKKFESKLRVVPNGVTFDHFASEVAVPSDVSSKTPYILFVGGLDKAHFFKGVDVLLKAWARINRDMGWHLVIVGSGNLLERYKQIARELGITDMVIFTGGVSDKELVAWYQSAQATVLPSITRGEAFGIVLLESMASGTPIIASNLPGVRSLVIEDVTGFLTEPGSQDDLGRALLKAIAADKKMMSIEVRKFARNYNWSSLAKQLEQIILES